MTRTIPATYENGVFRPLEPVDLPEHSPANVQVEAPSLIPSANDKPGIPRGITWKEMQKYRGILKSFDQDPVEWQRKMRDEEWL